MVRASMVPLYQWVRPNGLLDQCLNESLKPDAINQRFRINDPIDQLCMNHWNDESESMDQQINEIEYIDLSIAWPRDHWPHVSESAMQWTNKPMNQNQCPPPPMQQWKESMDYWEWVTVIEFWGCSTPLQLVAPMAGGPGGLIQKQYSNQSLNQWTNQSEIESMRSLNDSDNHNPHVIPHLAVGVCCRWANWMCLVFWSG